VVLDEDTKSTIAGAQVIVRWASFIEKKTSDEKGNVICSVPVNYTSCTVEAIGYDELSIRHEQISDARQTPVSLAMKKSQSK